MQAIPQIPGVSLEVYKQRRRVTPEADGSVGRLWSGSAVILAVIDPEADLTIGLFRDGSDHYIQQKDWLNNPRKESQQRCRELYLTGRKFPAATHVYGVKMPLRVDEERATNTVHYPENMLVLAQFVQNGQPTALVRVWKVALVSQDGEFFLTVQQAYETTAHRSLKGTIVLPRFRAHRQLERILAEHVPPNAELTPEHDFVPPVQPALHGLNGHEGIVERWYDARNMGCIITGQGPARVHWREVPPRPRRRFLVEGERVRFAELSQPPRNPHTKWRKMRKARFQLQAYGLRFDI